MREQENMERQALQAAEDAKIPCFKALVHKAQPVLQSAPIKIEPSDKPVTIPKAPVFHCDAHLGVLTTDLQFKEVTRQLLVTKVLTLFLNRAIIHAYATM